MRVGDSLVVCFHADRVFPRGRKSKELYGVEVYFFEGFQRLYQTRVRSIKPSFNFLYFIFIKNYDIIIIESEKILK